MTEEWILLGLRLLGAGFLLGFFATLMYFLRQDVRVVRKQTTVQPRQGRLVVVANDKTNPPIGTILPLTPNTTLGRSRASNIQIDNTYASYDHARLIQKMGQWWLEDRQSRNGTRLNGDLVHEAVVLSSGDIISIGALELRLELEP